MHLLIFIVVVGGLAFVAIGGVLTMFADLLIMDIRRPPSLGDKYFQEELEREDWDLRRLAR